MTDDEASTADELAAKEREIYEHPGSRAHRRITNLARVFEVWRDFTFSLDNVLLQCESDENVIHALMRQSEPRGREVVERELDKSLLAYVAGLVAVVDQSRPVMKLLTADLQKEAVERLNALKGGQPGAIFLAKLRNYVLHYLSAPWSFHAELIPEPARGSVGVSTAQLLEWPDWPKDAQEFLRGSGDLLLVRPLVRGHYEAQAAYVGWLHDAAHDSQATVRDEVNALIAERNLILTGGVSDGTDWSERTQHLQENVRRRSAGEPQISYDEWRQGRQRGPQ
ncbi:hypothetical protein [Microbacterium sp. LWH10-1.2]|uniref:hypothetical protein n=1 Tax=Microbacterium sp. LWH10-1.2 TaxID=3135255 RepID=UPI003139E306